MYRKRALPCLILLALIFTSSESLSVESNAADKLISDYSDNANSASNLIYAASDYAWNRRYDEAEKLYRAVISRQPDDTWGFKARLGMKRLEILNLIAGKNFCEAEKELDLMVVEFKGDPELAVALLQIGQEFSWQRRYDESRDAFDLIIKDFPENSIVPQARLWLRRADVCAIIRRTLPVADGNAVQATDEDVLAAVDDFIQDYETDAGLPEAMHWISQEYEWTKWAPGTSAGENARRYDTPNSVYQKLSQRFSQTYYGRQADWDSKRMAYRTKILTLMEKGDEAQSDSAVEQMVAEFSGRPEVPGELCRIAIWYEEHNKFDKAGEIYERIIAQFPDTNFAEESVQDVVRIATDANKNIDNGEAIGQLADRLRTRLGQTSQLASALYVVGREYQRQAQISEQVKGDLAGAKASLEKALQIFNEAGKLGGDSEKSAGANLQSGNCLFKLRKFPEALDSYKGIKSKWQGSRFEPDCLEGIGKCYEELAKRGQITQAQANVEIEQAYKELVQKYPDHRSNTEVLLKLGWLNFRQGEMQESISYFEKGLKKFPQDGSPTDVLYALAKMYEKTGQSDKALETYEKLQRMLPGGHQLDEINKKINQLNQQQ